MRLSDCSLILKIRKCNIPQNETKAGATKRRKKTRDATEIKSNHIFHVRCLKRLMHVPSKPPIFFHRTIESHHTIYFIAVYEQKLRLRLIRLREVLQIENGLCFISLENERDKMQRRRYFGTRKCIKMPRKINDLLLGTLKSFTSRRITSRRVTSFVNIFGYSRYIVIY